MMDSMMPVVLDISSDEEVWAGTGGGGGEFDYRDWISELLGPDEKEADRSDDVVIVDEIVLDAKPKKTVAEKPSVKILDDDCVVLDGDPDKPVAVESSTAGGDSDSDDLLIVGEKGQIACRDYPHARHLCAKFPFSSTPHERHCHQCHCYVCDSVAPCVHWGNGISSIDHCNATDKADFWKLQRKTFKSSLPVPKLPGAGASFSMGQLQTIQAPPLTPLQPNSLPRNQVSSTTTIRACSTSTNFGFPSITNQGRNQRSVNVFPTNRFHPYMVSQQLMSTPSNIIERDRRDNAGNLHYQFINSHATFKRSESAGVALTADRSGYSSCNNNHVTQYSRSPSLTAKNPTRWQDVSSNTASDTNAYQAPFLQNTSSRFGNSVLGSFGNLVVSHPQISSHPNTGSVFVNSVPSQPRVSSQPNIGSSYVTQVLSPRASSQPTTSSKFENPVPLPSHQVSSGPITSSKFENPVPSHRQVSLQPNIGSFVHQVPRQTQVYNQPIPTSNNRPTGFQLGNKAPNDRGTSPSGFNTSWVAPTGQSNQQSLVDNSQIRIAGQTYHPPSVTGFDPQIPAGTDQGSLDFEIESWLLESESVSGALDVSVPSGLDICSPEIAPKNGDHFLFDF